MPKSKIEYIGGPIDGTEDEIEDHINTVRVPEGHNIGWYEGPVSEHIYKRSEIESNKFYYKRHDDPKTVKKNIIEGMK